MRSTTVRWVHVLPAIPVVALCVAVVAYFVGGTGAAIFGFIIGVAGGATGGWLVVGTPMLRNSRPRR